MNFVRYHHEIIRLSDNKETGEAQRVITEIDNSSVRNKKWLLEKLKHFSRLSKICLNCPNNTYTPAGYSVIKLIEYTESSKYKAHNRKNYTLAVKVKP